MSVTSKDIVKALQRHHTHIDGWVLLSELNSCTGHDPENRLDAWAICCWKRKDISNLVRAFEIKVSRADFMKEIRNPDKSWFAKRVSHEFYFVAPAGLISEDELDPDTGLMELVDGDIHIVKRAKVRPLHGPKWTFVAGMLRHALKHLAPPGEKIPLTDEEIADEQFRVWLAKGESNDATPSQN